MKHIILMLAILGIFVGLIYLAAIGIKSLSHGNLSFSSRGRSGSAHPAPTPIPTGPPPHTFILGGPADGATVEFTEVTFSFSGSYPGGQPTDLRFQTKVEGIDQDWVSSNGGSRTISLLSGARSYAFSVRAITPLGIPDPNPARRTFYTNLSPYVGKVTIGSVNAGANPESITIGNGSGDTIEVSGWHIRSIHGEAVIPQAVPLFYYGFVNAEEPIRLTQGEDVVLYTGQGGPGDNLRLNRCVGYLNMFSIVPSFPQDCPLPSYWEIKQLSDQCQTFINHTLQACQIPDPNEPTLINDATCRDWMMKNLNYNACARNHERDFDFYQNEWRAWLSFGQFLYDPTHDSVRLYDQNGMLVDRRDY